ncbi:MAG: hypothetical protein HY653_08835, partial [Acidobacteria bacterium]|nr:hypothetical protein [Acidobacteriota bacterium]
MQINLRDTGLPDVGVHLSGNSITFSVEQAGSADVLDGSDLTAIRNSFAAINNITTSDAMVVDAGNIALTHPLDDDTGVNLSDG